LITAEWKSLNIWHEAAACVTSWILRQGKLMMALLPLKPSIESSIPL